ncbi:MAG TPA: AAA family ATPase, partial [Burkholderiaceae bacterium]|nr:AAA family ATPase [Burkholderiaceae bacterium]
MSETVLISGHAGVGKSALVHHLQRELAGTGGIFAGGKADPFKRETPFGSLAQNATRPSGPPSGALAALLLLAGIEPASSSRLASTPDAGPLGRVQLPF